MIYLYGSPQFRGVENTSYLSIGLDIKVDGIMRYTLLKNNYWGAGANVIFEISELVKNYIDVDTPTLTDHVSDVQLIFTGYSGYNGTGTATAIRTDNESGTLGYGFYYEGFNPSFSDDQVLLSYGSDLKIIAPEGYSGYIPYTEAGVIGYFNYGSSDTLVDINGQEVIIQRECDPKNSVWRCVFLNKFGALQEMFFLKRDILSTSVTNDQYNKINIDSLGSYDLQTHNIQKFNVIGKQSVTLNTGFVDHGFNEYVDQLMISPKVWLQLYGANFTGNNRFYDLLPVNVTMNSSTYKNHVYDKMINHTISFEFSNNIINDNR